MNQPSLQSESKIVQATSTRAESLQEIGYAVSINDYLISISGLPNAEINEIITTENNSRALVINLRDSYIEAVMLDDEKIKPKQMFKRTKKPLAIEVGNHLLGRVINPLGVAVDGKGKFPPNNKSLPIIQAIPPIKEREFIKDQFFTGVTTIDMLMPLAKGQRELVMGDARSGKTSFLIDVIANQRASGTICVYAIIGKPITKIRRLIDILSQNKSLDHTVIVAASSSEPASLINLTPDIAITIAEYFQSLSKDVLLILDDLGAHAKFYREVSLLSKKPPGRESYPGDIFYQHARILERAGNFNSTHNKGSITALPVIEIDIDDYTGFIPTNLMAMTDGHLMFSSQLYHLGTRPAIDISLSVSRVGRQTQQLTQKLLSDQIRSTLAEAKRVETLSRFGSEVSTQTQLLLRQRELISEILKQPPLKSIPLIIQMILLSLVFTPFFLNKQADFLTKNKDRLFNYLDDPKILKDSSQLVMSAKNDQQFVQAITKLIPSLEKICQA